MTSPRKARRRAFHAQQGYCFYCGYPMIESPDNINEFARRHNLKNRGAGPLVATAEHLQARCEGGKNTTANIVAAHVLCNRRRHRRKSTPTPENYRQMVQRRCARGGWHPPEVLRMPKRLPHFPPLSQVELSCPARAA